MDNDTIFANITNLPGYDFDQLQKATKIWFVNFITELFIGDSIL